MYLLTLNFVTHQLFVILHVQKMQEYDIMEFAKTQLTLPDKIDPGDEMSWQHYLYSKLGSKNVSENSKPQQIDEVVDRIVAMAKVLFGLHMVRHLYLYYYFCTGVVRIFTTLINKS